VAQHVASLYIVAASVVGTVLGRVIATVPFVMGGAYSAWFYLRFLQPNGSDASQQCAAAATREALASHAPLPVQHRG